MRETEPVPQKQEIAVFENKEFRVKLLNAVSIKLVKLSVQIVADLWRTKKEEDRIEEVLTNENLSHFVDLVCH